MSTFMQKKEAVVRKWYVVDAAGKPLGRTAVVAADLLRGKNAPEFTPHVDCGNFVIIINADKIEVTGNKLDGKKYYNHSGYAGGLRVRTARTMKEHYTIEWVERSVHGMLPHTKLGDKMRRHLFVYTGAEHPHAAQQPVELKIKG